jgi:cytoskeletal protein CcmA (bactofilin family)
MWTPKPTDSSDSAQTPGSTPASSAPLVDERRVVSWVGKAVVFKGELFSSEDMRIEGRVEGTIDVRDHDLIVGPNATINADVVAKTISVRGTVTGTLTASDRIEIRETATIAGDVTAPRLAIIEGATVEGRIHTMPRKAAAEEPDRPRLANVG